MARSTKARPVVRIVVVAALALGGAMHVVRSAVVQQNVASRPDMAAMLWPNHPRVVLALSLAEIGKAASGGQAPSKVSVARSLTAAQRAPLAVEPFLIQGTIAQSGKRDEDAERLFVEAARRDPRSSAARFFLSQLYLSSKRPGEGLRHASVLVRLSGGSAALVPAIAAYAKSPGAVPTLRAMFARDVAMRDAVLSALALDASNYGVIVALAGNSVGKGGLPAVPGWQAQLLNALIERGDFARARTLWLRISGLPTSPPTGLFNPQFAKLRAPAPFNWTFGSGEFGFAEPTTNGSLQVVFYGRVDGQFVNQTLLLAPGAYQLRMRVMRETDRDQTSGLAWIVACGQAAKVLITLPVGNPENVARSIAGQFTVPSGCLSQTIKLVGTASEEAASEQLTINNFQLVRLAS